MTYLLLFPHPAHKRTFLLPASEGWRACLAWASHPDCADADERAEMLSFAAANADATAIADIMASKAEKRTPARRKRKAVDDDDDGNKRPGIGRVLN